MPTVLKTMTKRQEVTPGSDLDKRASIGRIVGISCGVSHQGINTDCRTMLL